RCHLAGLSGEMLTANELDVRSSTFTGVLHLPRADIVGQLNCNGAKLRGKDDDGNALAADGLKVGGDLLLRGASTAKGAVWLLGTDIAGQLDCNGAKLRGKNDGGNALVADGLKADGVFFTGDFTAAGAVRLPGAEIARQLSFKGAKLTKTDNVKNTLSAD